MIPATRAGAYAGVVAPPLPQLRRNFEFDVRWATCASDVEQAQRLRYMVFADEMGARLSPPPGTRRGLDVDRFDAFCDHLLVYARELGGDDAGQLVGTYRVLGPDAALRAGGYYTDTEFDLAPLATLRPRAVELGRACVHPDWRSGGVIMALWGALGKYMMRNRLDTMIGCASIGLADGGRQAHAVWQHLRESHLVAPQWQVTPLRALVNEGGPAGGAPPHGRPHMPPLLKGYLRCGARVLGAPAHDPAFNTADLPIMLRIDELSTRYREQFLAR